MYQRRYGRDIYIEQAWVVNDTGQDECELVEFFLALPDTIEVNPHVEQR